MRCNCFPPHSHISSLSHRAAYSCLACSDRPQLFVLVSTLSSRARLHNVTEWLMSSQISVHRQVSILSPLSSRLHKFSCLLSLSYLNLFIFRIEQRRGKANPSETEMIRQSAGRAQVQIWVIQFYELNLIHVTTRTELMKWHILHLQHIALLAHRKVSWGLLFV